MTKISHDNRLYGPPTEVTNSLSGMEGDKQFVWSGPQVTNSLSGVHQPMRICVSHPIYNKHIFVKALGWGKGYFKDH